MFCRFVVFFLILMSSQKGISSDTLYSNPNYPPLVYTNSEITFYKYTPRFAPNDLFHAFKILGTTDSEIVERFRQRTEKSVLHNGIHFASSRLRKEFCLEGYSDFVAYFHVRGIYYPYAMETYILLAFHQYLNQEKIAWKHNKLLALQNNKKMNRLWKKRKRKLFKGTRVKEKKEEDPKKGKTLKNEEEEFWDLYQF